MNFSGTMRELQEAGLLDFSHDVPQLTERGRDYLRLLDEVEALEAARAGEQTSADLVFSIHALIR